MKTPDPTVVARIQALHNRAVTAESRLNAIQAQIVSIQQMQAYVASAPSL